MVSSLPGSPAPPANATLEESLKFYKSQYEALEAELVEFQASSKDLEAILEKDVEDAEKRERKLREEAADLKYQVDEWKSKHKQAKSEANAAQNTLEKEVKTLRQENLSLRQQLRDTEVANDDYERKQRTTEVSLEDLEQRYNQMLERETMLQEEVKAGEQERELLRIETQRLKEECSDLRIEAEVIKKKFEKVERELDQYPRSLTVQDPKIQSSPRSEFSPAATDTSGPSFGTPSAKTATSSVSDATTPPSPTSSEQRRLPSKNLTTPLPKSRMSYNANSITPRPVQQISKPAGHNRNTSIATMNLQTPRPVYRQSTTATIQAPTTRASGLPQSASMCQLQQIQIKMQRLAKRIENTKSTLPVARNSPARNSPRTASALSSHIPSTITMRSSKKRATESTISGADTTSVEDEQSTPSVSRLQSHRQSLTSQYQRPESPTKGAMAAPPRPGSRTSIASSRHSMSHTPYGHSRPQSRASISGLHDLQQATDRARMTANASTDHVRSHSSLSSHKENEDDTSEDAFQKYMANVNRSPRKSLVKRPSDFGMSNSIPPPTATKRLSIGGGAASRLPAFGAGRRQSGGINPVPHARPLSSSSNREKDPDLGSMRPSSRQRNLRNVTEDKLYDDEETF